MSPAEREELILSLGPLVKIIARARLGPLPGMVRLDDILSAAWLGAIEAVDRFDPANGAPLAGFARWKINGAIGDYLRSLDPVSRDQRRLLRAQPDAQAPRIFSIHSAHHDDGGRVFDIGDKRSLAAVRRIEARLDLAAICSRSVVQPRHLRMLQRHAHGETMKDIGRSEGVKESRVSQICKRTLSQLRAAA